MYSSSGAWVSKRELAFSVRSRMPMDAITSMTMFSV